MTSTSTNAGTRHWIAAAVLMACATGASAQTRFFADDGFRGRSFTTSSPVRDFSRMGFNDRASSVVVRGGPWEICSDARFGGSCVVLRPGRYGSLRSMNLNDRVSSARPARRGPPPR